MLMNTKYDLVSQIVTAISDRQTPSLSNLFREIRSLDHSFAELEHCLSTSVSESLRQGKDLDESHWKELEILSSELCRRSCV